MAKTNENPLLMDLETIEKLIQFMEDHGLNELQVREGDLEFKARRGDRREAPFIFQPTQALSHAAGDPAAAGPAKPGAAPAAAEAGHAAPKGSSKAQKEICSPLVGTFYRRPNPTAPPYKEVGDHVENGEVVCIVEAMKVMNEIKSDVTGTVKRILLEDATPVEFGQPLFMVEQA